MSPEAASSSVQPANRSWRSSSGSSVPQVSGSAVVSLPALHFPNFPCPLALLVLQEKSPRDFQGVSLVRLVDTEPKRSERCRKRFSWERAEESRGEGSPAGRGVTQAPSECRGFSQRGGSAAAEPKSRCGCVSRHPALQNTLTAPRGCLTGSSRSVWVRRQQREVFLLTLLNTAPCPSERFPVPWCLWNLPTPQLFPDPFHHRGSHVMPG